jgi:hypothetical protein
MRKNWSKSRSKSWSKNRSKSWSKNRSKSWSKSQSKKKKQTEFQRLCTRLKSISKLKTKETIFHTGK